MSDMTPRISIDQVWKVFGEHPERAFDDHCQSMDAEQLHNQTGLKAAVRDVTLSISSGEIFVVMDLVENFINHQIYCITEMRKLVKVVYGTL